MKKIICDYCGSNKAKSYKYIVNREMDPSGNGYNPIYDFVDLCVNCISDWVLKNQTKLTEVAETVGSVKKIIHG